MLKAEDPYASMEKDQLISMIHFLVKREEERAQENQELKDMVKELRDTHKQDVKTQTNLMKSIDNLTNQVADLTTQNKTLQQKVNDLLSQISVGNKVRFGSKSQKGIRKNATPIQDRDKDKDDFDGTNGAAISSASQADMTSAEADTEPGTHASCSLLANLVFNKYHMNTPVYREMERMLNNRMNVSRNTVYNWFVKGSEYLKKVLPLLKEKLLAKGAVVNCDETWCRVKVTGKYGKKYLWCMVNKEAKVAVYFYDDGSRGRKVLRDFLGETQIDALQSDGFRSRYCVIFQTSKKKNGTF